MKALVVESDGTATVKDVPQPHIGEYEALVKMKASSMCGTDMKILHNNLKGFTDYPTILGHEGVGEVVKVGTKVRNFAVGDQVILPYILEKCGEYYATWGAIAEYATVGDTDAMVADGLPMDEKVLHEFNFAQRKIPSDFEPVAATMIVTFREVYSTMLRMNFHKGQGIVIYGAGPVGLTFIRLAKHIGMSPIVCIDRKDEKMQQALDMGADYAINSVKEEIEPQLNKIFPEGIEVLLDAAGVPALINQNLKLVRNFGKVCVYGVTPKNELMMSWQEAPYNFDLKFVQWPSKKEEAAVHDEIIKMIEDGVLKGKDFISDVFDFSKVEEAVEFFKAGKNNKKIAIRF